MSQKLSSDRPVSRTGSPNGEISEQKIDTWLWEDPFGHINQAEERRFDKLVGQPLIEKEQEGVTNVHILAAMVPGGPASEDRERRIRSRYAMVSALAESGYAPEHPSHIGVAEMRWPDSSEFSAELPKNQMIFASLKRTNYMHYAFEWYTHEYFVPNASAPSTNAPPVLLLWLDEDQFEDYPIARLHWFSQNLADTNLVWANQTVSLIGPGRSDTLKSIFAHDFDSRTNHTSRANQWTNYAYTKNIHLFLASPRAVDEVLVQEITYPKNAPRQALLQRLTNYFASAWNFAATDSDLAHGILSELSKRGVKLASTEGKLEDNLVLIEGWDDYFGRMLTAAYAAELSLGQSPPGINRATFFADFHTGQTNGPSNLHTFHYYSGLDGQGLSTPVKNGPQQESAEAGSESDAHTKPKSQSSWTPDVNRAEGPAQNDYLGRLARQIGDLDDKLRKDGKGHISAIGIGGGDVYDTLLILQALRRRFPETVFFVTELDARLWDPKEWPWSRNVIAVSDYGLRLSDKLQRHTSSFRDSVQTAQFAAALAALGNTSVPTITGTFPVRLFEIGRHGPVDLSADHPDWSTNYANLHPEVPRWSGVTSWIRIEYRYLVIPGIFICALLLAVTLSRNFRRLTTSRHHAMAAPLWLREEDIGDLQGFCELAFQLARTDAGDSPEKQWLSGLVKCALEHAETELNQSFAEQEAPSAFTEADIADPEGLIQHLNQAFNSPGPPEPVFDRLAKHLPARSKVILKDWTQNSEDRVNLLSSLVEDLRHVMRTVELPPLQPAANPNQTNQGKFLQKPLWLRNREHLAEKYDAIFRPPVGLKKLLIPANPLDPDAWRTWRASQRIFLTVAMKDPDRRDAMRSAMLSVLDTWNAQMADGFSDIEKRNADPCGCREECAVNRHPAVPPILTGDDLDRLKESRDLSDKLIACLLPKNKDEELDGFKAAAEAARAVSRDLFQLCTSRNSWASLIVVVGTSACTWMFYANIRDTPYSHASFSGASLWPSNWLCLLAAILGSLFINESFFKLRNTVLMTTRQCRLPYEELDGTSSSLARPPWRFLENLRAAIQRVCHPSTSEPKAVIVADELWKRYQRQGCGTYRFFRTIFLGTAYLILLMSVCQFILGHNFTQHQRAPAGDWYKNLTWLTFILFLFLSFWTIDAAYLCRWFIGQISQGPTRYSLVTRQHFSKQRGHVPHFALSEWIDVSIIAQITERVGMLIYFPAIMFLLLLLANNDFLYYFPWPPAFYFIATCNFGVAAASVFIVQRAARKAREQSLVSLQEKLSELKVASATTERSRKEHDISETEDLLNEIRNLKKGAFGGIWSNPLLGALLLPSGGTAIIEIIRFFVK